MYSQSYYNTRALQNFKIDKNGLLIFGKTFLNGVKKKNLERINSSSSIFIPVFLMVFQKK